MFGKRDKKLLLSFPLFSACVEMEIIFPSKHFYKGFVKVKAINRDEQDFDTCRRGRLIRLREKHRAEVEKNYA
jgi:hypothetical protein